MPKVNMYATEKEYIHLVKQGPGGPLRITRPGGGGSRPPL